MCVCHFCSFFLSIFYRLIAIMKPDQSWAARCIQTDKGVPGCYAVHVSRDLPEKVHDKISYRLGNTGEIEGEV